MSYIGCIWERENTQLLCLLQISFSSNHHAYKMFAYLKRQIRSVFLLKRSSLSVNLIIHSLSVRHNWQTIELVFPRTFDTIDLLMGKLMLTRFNYQVYLATSILFPYFLCLKLLVWFLYLSLKGVSAKSKYKIFYLCLHH